MSWQAIGMTRFSLMEKKFGKKQKEWDEAGKWSG
jgi:hypothetical protein